MRHSTWSCIINLLASDISLCSLTTLIVDALVHFVHDCTGDVVVVGLDVVNVFLLLIFYLKVRRTVTYESNTSSLTMNNIHRDIFC